MKIRSLILVLSVSLTSLILVYFFMNMNEVRLDVPSKPILLEQPNTIPKNDLGQVSSENEIESGLILGSGPEHLKALEAIMTWLREQHVLKTEDQAILLNYLQQEQPETMTSGEWEERVNEILNFLRAQPNAVPGLADLMLHMAQNDQNSVLRMYAMQHIYLGIPDEPDAEKREAMMSYLRRVAATPSDMHSGAAVMFLSDLELGGRKKGESSNDETISRAALRLVENKEVNTAARISALHTCTERRVIEALPAARLLAADTMQMIPLRKAAIHAIGQMGETKDISTLKNLAGDTPELEAAITPAVSQLQLTFP